LACKDYILFGLYFVRPLFLYPLDIFGVTGMRHKVQVGKVQRRLALELYYEKKDILDDRHEYNHFALVSVSLTKATTRLVYLATLYNTILPLETACVEACVVLGAPVGEIWKSMPSIQS
jgi:hypothetical protein